MVDNGGRASASLIEPKITVRRDVVDWLWRVRRYAMTLLFVAMMTVSSEVVY